MALAIDASTPVYKSTTTAASSLTTVSFTPPVGSELVVLYSNADLAIGINKPTNTGGAVTWDAAVAASELANSCGAAVWRGLVTTSASMTVTVTPTSISQTDWGFGVAVVTGQAATQNGATGVATSASGIPSVTTSALVGSNSLVLGAFANDFNATVGTPGAGQSLTFNAHVFSLAASGSSDWAQYLTGMNLSAGVTATLNDTAPTGVNYCAVALEILAATGAAPSVPTRYVRVRPKPLLLRKTRIFDPPWLQGVLGQLPPTSPPTNKAQRDIILSLRPRKTLLWGQWWPALINPNFRPVYMRSRVKPALQRRARMSEFPGTPLLNPFPVPPQVIRPRIKPMLQRRGKTSVPPKVDSNFSIPVYVRPRVKPLLARRTRFYTYPIPSVVPDKFPPCMIRPQVKPALRRRAAIFSPVPPQGAQGAAVLDQRTVVGSGL